MTSTREPERLPLPLIPKGFEENRPKEGMRVKTPFNFDTDMVSSAMQKSIRRGMVEESIQWAVILSRASKARNTNTKNRLLVISMEDVSPSNVFLPLKLIKLFEEFPDDIKSISTAAGLLAKANKSRVNDWAAHIFQDKHEPGFGDKLGTLEYMKNSLCQSLIEKDALKSIYWVDVLTFSKLKMKRIKGVRYTVPQYIIWLIFEYITKNSPYLEPLKRLALSNNWRWPGRPKPGKRDPKSKTRLIYTHLINLHCFSYIPDNNGGDYTKPIIDPYFSTVADKVMLGEGLLGIPDYAVDMHTRRGREMSRDASHFWKEGAKVDNEDKMWDPIINFYLEVIKLNDPNTKVSKVEEVKDVAKDKGKHEAIVVPYETSSPKKVDHSPVLRKISKFPGSEKRMVILMTGNKDYIDGETLTSVITSFLGKIEIGVLKSEMMWTEGERFGIHRNKYFIVDCGSSGADTLIGNYRRFRDIPGETVDFSPIRHHIEAKPIRNATILEKFKPNVVIGFDKRVKSSVNTRDMLNKAFSSNIPSYLVYGNHTQVLKVEGLLKSEV